MAAWRDLDDEPIQYTWHVDRGTSNADYETKPVYFVLPVSATDLGFTETVGPYGSRTITVTSPLDITGRVFFGSVTAVLGGTALATISLVDEDPTDGEAYLAIARSELLKLPTGRYPFDGGFDLGTDDETTWMKGTLVVSGRATA